MSEENKDLFNNENPEKTDNTEGILKKDFEKESNKEDILPESLEDESDKEDILSEDFEDESDKEDILPESFEDESDKEDMLPEGLENEINEEDILPKNFEDESDEEDILPVSLENRSIAENTTAIIHNENTQPSNIEPFEANTTNKKPFFIFGIVAAVIVVVFAVFAFGKIGNDKSKVFKAIGKTFVEMANPSTLSKSIGTQDIINKIIKDSYTQEVEIVFDKYKLGSTVMNTGLEGSSFDLKNSLDRKNKFFSANLWLSYKSTPLVGADFYSSNDNFMFSIPALFEGNISIPTKNIKQAYDNSVIKNIGNLGEFPYPDDFELDFFTEGLNTREQYAELYNSFNSINKKGLSKIYDNIVVEKNGQEEIKGRGNCTVYNVKIGKEDIISIFDLMYEFIKNDKYIKEQFNKSAEVLYAKNQHIYSSADEVLEEMYENLDTNIKQMQEMVIGDVVFNVYVDSKDYAVKFLSESISEVDRDLLSINCEFNGTDNIFDNIIFNLELAGSHTSDVLSVVKNTTIDGSKIRSLLEGELRNSSDSYVKLSLDTVFDKSGSTLSTDGYIEVDGEQVNLNLNGNIDTSSKNLCNIELDKIAVLYDDGNGVNEFNFKGKYTLSSLNEIIEEPEGKVYDLFNMNQDELSVLESEIQKNIQSYMSMFYMMLLGGI